MADASLELLMRRAAGWEQDFFEVEAFRVSTDDREGPVMPAGEVEVATEATVKVWVGGERIAAAGEGNGPVNALDAALRAALGRPLPGARAASTSPTTRCASSTRGKGTGAVTRVLIDSTDGERVVDHDRRRARTSSRRRGRRSIDSLRLRPAARRRVGSARRWLLPSTSAAHRSTKPRVYVSPPRGRGSWRADRPGELDGRQPSGTRLGTPGPDQGFALKLASASRAGWCSRPGERADDAIAGCIAIALRRASLFGRAPVIHDLTIAFTLWGFLDEAPAELTSVRKERFAAVASTHHYEELRALVDAVPDDILRMTPVEVAALVGVNPAYVLTLGDAAPAH